MIQEGKAKIDVFEGVFFRKDKKIDRDISVAIIKNSNCKKAIDLLAGTGIRGIRFYLEGGVKDLYLNDANPIAFKNIKHNLKINKIEAKVFNEEANKLLWNLGEKFDWIDIDPFGSPVYFLQAAIKHMRKGILATAATDKGALAGKFKDVALRRYGVFAKFFPFYEEYGARVLIKRVVEFGGMYEKLLIPIYTLSHQHYYRIYFRVEFGNAHKLKAHFENIKFYEGTGPIWMGKLYDLELAKSILKDLDEDSKKLGEKILWDAQNDIPFYYYVPFYCKKLKINTPPTSKIIEELKNRGYTASKTHFKKQSIKTNAPEKEFIAILKSL